MLSSSASFSKRERFSIGWISCKCWWHFLLWWLLLLWLWALAFFRHLFYFWLLYKMRYMKISHMQRVQRCYRKQRE